MTAESSVDNPILVILFGLVFVLVGVWLFGSELKRRRLCTVQTEGVIVGVENKRRKNRSHYFPVTSYTVNGMEYTGTGEERAFSHSIKIGQEVTVLYNPDDPNTFMLREDRWRRLNILWMLLFLAMGLLIESLYKPKRN